MKTILYALLGLLAVAVAAVLLGPSFVDWTAYRGDIAARLTEATGRKVVIRGDVAFRVLPRPALSIGDIRVAGSAGTGNPPALAAKTVRMRLRVAPLLQGAVRLSEVRLIEPRITVAADRTGFRAFDPSAATRTPPGPLSLGGDIRVERLRLIGGVLQVEGDGSAPAAVFRGLDARVTLGAGGGGFDGRGHAVWRDLPLRFEASLGQLARAGDTPFGLILRPDRADPQAEVSLQGALTSTAPLAGRAKIDLRGPNLAAILRRFDGGADRVPRLAEQTFSLDADVRFDDGTVVSETLDMALGPVSLSGTGEVALGTPLRVRGDLRLQRLDLDALMAKLDAAEGEAAPDGEGEEARDGAPKWSPPRGVEAEVSLRAGAVVYRKQVIRQGRMTARLSQGRVQLRRASALLPGGSDVTLSGELAARQGTPRFEGRVEAASNNLRGLFDWLGLSVDRVPPDRLRRMSLLAAVDAGPGRITLTDVDLEVDTLRAEGGVAVALGARPGFGVGLRVNRLDLDAYWAPEQADTVEDGAPGEGPKGKPRAALGAFDANLDLRIGSLTRHGREASDVRLTGTLSRGDLTLREFAAQAAGGTVRLDGTVAGLDVAAPRLDLNMNWTEAAPRRALGWIGLPDAVPADWPSMSLTGLLRGTAADLDVDMALQALDGLFTARGKVRDAAGDAPGASLDVAAQHDSLGAVVRRLTAHDLPSREDDGVDLSAQVRASPDRVQLRNLGGKLGPVQLSGLVEATFGEVRPRPHLRINLETGTLPLPALLPVATGGAGPLRARAGDWSATPLDLAALRAVDGALTLNASRLRLGGAITLRRAAVRGTLSNGVLDLSRFAGDLGGGRFSALATLDAKGTPTLSAVLDVKDVDFAALLGQGVGGVRVTGPLSARASLRARGRSERALIETLTGSGEVEGSPRLRLGAAGAATDAAPKAGESLLRAVLGPFLGGLANVQAAADRIDSAFRDRPLTLSGRWAAEGGVLRAMPLRLDGAGMTGRLTGRANLPDWRSDARVAVVRTADAAGGEDAAVGDDMSAPLLKAGLQGMLDAPDVRVAGQVFTSEAPAAPREPVTPATPETPQTPANPEPLPAGEPEAAEEIEGERQEAEQDGDAADSGEAAPSGGESATDADAGTPAAAPSAEQIIDDLLKDLPRPAPEP